MASNERLHFSMRTLQFKLTDFVKKLNLKHDEERKMPDLFYNSILQSLEKRWEDIENDWIMIQVENFKQKLDTESLTSVKKS